MLTTVTIPDSLRLLWVNDMAFTFIDLFAGIGGFHVAMSKLGVKCVFASEIDKKARETYLANHHIDNFAGDINLINPKDIPDHDILCAGFPSQSFGQDAFKKGLKYGRDQLFWRIVDIIKEKKPACFFFENVRNLKTHDAGHTYLTMRHEIKNLGYTFNCYNVSANHHGIPQARPRLFIIGFRDGLEYSPPEKRKLELTMSDVLGGKCDKKIGYTLRAGGKGSFINSSRHDWDLYWVDGKSVGLTVDNAKVMQGFPKDFVFPVSEREAMNQLSNSTAVETVFDYANNILKTLSE